MTDQKQRITEAEAIEQAKQGNEAAFEILYHLHKRRVYSLCLRMVSNPAQAEDLAQEAFLQLFRKIGTFRGESAFSTWLHRMTVNVVLMQLRKKGLPVVSLEETLEADDEAPRKEFGTKDLKLTGSIDRLQLQRAIDRCRRAIERFLCCTILKDSSITKLPKLWAARSATASRSSIRHD